jgi:hypothetical protein
MATNKPTCSHVRIQSLSRDLAAIHAWVALKAVCGHSIGYFDDGPDALPVEPTAPLCPVLAGAAEVCHA